MERREGFGNFLEALPVKDILRLVGLVFLFGMIWARSEAHILQLRENTTDIRMAIQSLNSKLEATQKELAQIRYELVETRAELKFGREAYTKSHKEQK